MSGTICSSAVQFCRLRIARLAANGDPVAGPHNLYVTDTPVKLAWKVVVKAGVDLEKETGCGAVCTTFKDCDRLKRYDLDLEVCSEDPELYEILEGGILLTDLAGDSRGYGGPRIGEPNCPNGVSVEGWARNVIDDFVDPTFPWIRFVFPRATFRQNDSEISNTIKNNAFVGEAKENPMWLDGPGHDWPYDSSRAKMQAFDTTAPDAHCGYQMQVS